ncbi:MAG TPA: hypothetical protein VJ625_17170 [Propionibacteriaceae bacterium]|nr:hypothetical protein [Propionibacteriaceae bacterium]
MSSWVCRDCSNVFPPNMPACTNRECGAQNAYEQGEPDGPNVYETLPEIIAAEKIAQSIELKAMNDRQLARASAVAHEHIDAATAAVTPAAEAEVAERLGDVLTAEETRASTRKTSKKDVPS